MKKTGLKWHICLLTFIVTFVTGCGGGGSSTNQENADSTGIITETGTITEGSGNTTSFQTPTKSVLVETGDPAVPYIAFHKDGSSFSVAQETPTEISGTYTLPTGDEIYIIAGQDGIPKEAHFDNATMVFQNVRNNLMDVALIVDGSDVQVFRDINFINENPDLQGLLLPSANKYQFQTSQKGVRDLMRALVIAGGAAACAGTAIVSVTATLGAAIPAVALACASPFLGLFALAEAKPKANGDLSDLEKEVMVASERIVALELTSCGLTLSPVDCILAAADAIHAVFDKRDLLRRQLQEKIRDAAAALASIKSRFRIVGYQNINGESGQGDTSSADIKLSGSLEKPLISWPLGTATILQIVESSLLQNTPPRVVYYIESEPLTNADTGKDITKPFNMPVLYGNYAISNIGGDEIGPIPSPPLRTNKLYSMIIANSIPGSSQTQFASIVFRLN